MTHPYPPAKNILHVSCSPRGRIGESSRLARRVVEHLQQHNPAAIVVERAICDGSLPHVDTNYATAQRFDGTPVHAEGAIATSETLIRELEAADAVVIGTPMHNMTVPSVLKAWIDHVVRARRTFAIGPGGKVGSLRDRPVYVAIASGGRFSGERAARSDFLTPYLRAVLAHVGLLDLTFFSVEGTDFGADAVAEARAAAERAMHAHFSPRAMRPKAATHAD